MKISKLLKSKNKLSGEINRLQGLIAQENVVENDNTSLFDVLKLYEEYNLKSKELCEVKTTLAIANVAIYDKIFEMAELKGKASFLHTLDVRQGKYITGRGDTKTELVYTPAISKIFVDEEIKKISTKIEEIQEKLDEFNHTSNI
jgi:hypothetical protein